MSSLLNLFQGMLTPPHLGFTLMIAAVVGAIAFVIAAIGCFLAQRRKGLVVFVFVFVEVVGAFLLLLHYARQSGTGLEWLPLPGMVIGIVMGNMLSILFVAILRRRQVQE